MGNSITVHTVLQTTIYEDTNCILNQDTTDCTQASSLDHQETRAVSILILLLHASLATVQKDTCVPPNHLLKVSDQYAFKSVMSRDCRRRTACRGLGTTIQKHNHNAENISDN